MRLYAGFLSICTTITSILIPNNAALSVEIPRDYSLTQDAVPRNIVMDIAAKKAESMWGNVIPGPVIPMVAGDRKLIAYYVVFARNGRRFPDDSTLLRDLREGRELRNEGLKPSSRAGDRDDSYDRGRRLTWGIDDYCTVLMTARYSMKPVPEYFEGLPRFYTMGDIIERKAQDVLGIGVELKYIYFSGRLDQVYEFRGGGTYYIDPFPIEPVTSAEFDERIVFSDAIDCQVDEKTPAERREEWDRLYEDPPVPASIVRVNHYEWIPILLWTAGCAPTAAAMVTGFYDNKYDVSGYFNSYGRLVDYYRAEYKFPCSDSGGLRTSIPNTLDEFVLGMGTNCQGSTPPGGIATGLDSVTNYMNLYDFDIVETENCDTPGQNCYDWCWPEIVRQINDGFPFVWGVACQDCPPGTIRGHALAAFGYNDTDSTVAVYNTWDEQEHWWCHDHYGDNCNWPSAITWVFAVHPGPGGSSDDLRLESPAGGEVFYACLPDTITWYQWGDLITRVSIMYSTDSGAHWPADSYVISGLSSEGQGMHEFIWSPPSILVGENIRIKVMGFEDSGRLVASEGSRYDFILLPGVYVMGDVNSDDTYNGLDIVYGVAYFKGGPPPPYECDCPAGGGSWYVSGDVNGSCSYNGLDITFGVSYFKGGDRPLPCPDCPPE